MLMVMLGMGAVKGGKDWTGGETSVIDGKASQLVCRLGEEVEAAIPNMISVVRAQKAGRKLYLS
jgi:hypothetical protein